MDSIKNFFKHVIYEKILLTIWKFLKKIWEVPVVKTIVSSVLCIVFGFIVGIIVMGFLTISNEEASFSDGIHYLFSGPFSSTREAIVKANLGNMIFYASPLIMCGLSVAIAYKTGLFNIGAPGQYLMGTMTSLLIALNINCTSNRFAGILVWILAVTCGMIAGALWGMIPGALKALFNINEVVVCIMTNWIAGNIVTWVFTKTVHLQNIPATKTQYLFMPKEFGTYTPTFGLDKLLPNSYIDGSIIIAIIIAIALFIIMNKTTLGYELKACGSNKHAAKYAGMNEKRNIIISMAIAGALAGLGGAFYYLNKGIELNYVSCYQSLPDYGFNGIPAALLANCDPIGTIFTSLFLRYISASGSRLQLSGYNAYIASIITAVIIYCAGFSRLFLMILSKKKKKAVIIEKTDATAETKTEEKKEETK